MGLFWLSCADQFQGVCQWELQGDTSTGQLFIGWPEGEGIVSEPVADSLAIGGDAVLDGGGRIHMVVLHHLPSSQDTRIRYLRLGL